MVELLKRGSISPTEAVQTSIARMEAVDASLNALPMKCAERALAAAKKIEAGKVSVPDPARWLGGLPVAIKDLNPVAGVTTTYGSRIYAAHVPDRSDVLVDNAESGGAIVMAKSNTPEFGAGASTFNEVYGRTRNPWDTSKSVAGSSGGSAAALASGQVWLAHGSDLGGSLRTPASFNGVVGLRPSPGRVPRGLFRFPFDTATSDLLFVEGPMARTASDCALMLDALSGAHPEDPLSLPRPAESFLSQVQNSAPPKRVAYSPDLGFAPVSREVAAVCERAVAAFVELGAEVEIAHPDLSGATDCFQVLRAALFAADHREHLLQHRSKLKEDVIWNTERGLALSGDEIAAAEAQRLRIIGNCLAFLEDFDVLVCPAAIVPPFAVETRYVEEVEGHRFDNYVEWIAITFCLSLTACPVACAPIGLSASGLPIGIQILASPRQEARALAAAHFLDQITGFSKQFPRTPQAAT